MKKINIQSCYCEIPRATLIGLVRLRYVDGIETQELMKRMKSEKEREYLATIALLDVKEEELVNRVHWDNPSALDHLLCCRARAREILGHEGYVIKER